MNRTYYIVASLALLAGAIVCAVLAQHGQHPYNARYVDSAWLACNAEADSIIMAHDTYASSGYADRSPQDTWHSVRDGCMRQRHAK